MKFLRNKLIKMFLAAGLLLSTVAGLTQTEAAGTTELLIEVDGFADGYKNGFYANGTQVYVNTTAVTGFQTVRVPVSSSLLTNGLNTITLRSGTVNSPTETVGNNDDFNVRNVRLKLAEGTIYPAESAKVYKADGTSTTTTPSKTDLIWLGDGNPPNDATAKQKADFTFTVGSAKLLMEVDGFASGYLNGVYLGSTTLKVFNQTTTGFVTVEVPVSNQLLQKGNNTITLTSGTTSSPTGTAGNNDDFNVRNIRLVLADNKEIAVGSVKVYNADGTSTTTNNPSASTSFFLGDGSPANDATAKTKADFSFSLINYDFTFAMLPDTQYYSESYPGIFNSQTQWIVDKREEKNIQYVISVGDIVDNWDVTSQWTNADAAYKKLDNAGIPYGVVAGNHDVNFANANYTNYWTYFGAQRFQGKPWYGGQIDNNRDHYDLISTNGKNFIILYFGWQIDQQSYDWANSVLAQYPNHNAIIATHEYISPTGAYSGQGQSIWNNVVSVNNNVFLVVCGHLHGTAYNVKTVGTQKVIELLADYQSAPEGGSGYMKLLHFNLANNQMIVNAYSPYKKDYNYFSNDETTLNVTLK